MTVWRYYEVSKGKDLDFNNNKVEPAIIFLHCKFTKIDQITYTTHKARKRNLQYTVHYVPCISILSLPVMNHSKVLNVLNLICLQEFTLML